MSICYKQVNNGKNVWSVCVSSFRMFLLYLPNVIVSIFVNSTVIARTTRLDTIYISNQTHTIIHASPSFYLTIAQSTCIQDALIVEWNSWTISQNLPTLSSVKERTSHVFCYVGSALKIHSDLKSYYDVFSTIYSPNICSNSWH